MKKIRLVAIFFVSIFSFNLLVKADASYRYCQYDKKGDYYVIGDCNHYFSEEQDRNTLAPLSCSYGGNEHYDLIGNDNVHNSNTNRGCPDSIIFGGRLGGLGTTEGTTYKLFANRVTVSDENSEYTYQKYYHSGGYYYFNYIYYCKVGSTSWCLPPQQNAEKYYSIIQEAEIIEENNQKFTELRCIYGNDNDNPVYCNTSTGKCMMFNSNGDEVYINANNFISEGHYYCPKVKNTNVGVQQDLLNQLFQNSQTGNNTNQKYCNYPILKDSKGNEYEFKISYYLDDSGKAISITPTLNCKSGNCTMNFRGYLDNQAIPLGELLKNCYNVHNDRECPEIKLDEHSNYLEVEYCSSPFNQNGTGGESSDNPGSVTDSTIPGQENDRYSDVETCTDVDVNHIKACGCIPAEVADITSKVYFVLRLIGPIILLIIGGFEMAKAIAAQDESAIEKAKKKLVNKFIAAAAIFLVLTIIKLAVSLVAENSPGIFECVNILLDGYVI